MSIDKTIFFCLKCDASSFSKETLVHNGCQNQFYIIEADVTFRKSRTRSNRFLEWFFSKNISLGLAFLGAVLINAVLISQMHLSLGQVTLEGLGLGFLLPRIIK
jgi:hypothetical protein